MKRLLYIFVPILLLTLYYCSETSNPVQSQSPKPRVFIKSIEPSQLQVGMDYKIAVGHENGNLDLYQNVVFNNRLWHDADSVRGDTIYSYVPYIHFAPLYRELKIQAQIDSAQYYDIDTVYVFPNTCQNGVCISWNDLKNINENDSHYWGKIWTGETNQDTVILTHIMPFGDDGTATRELKLISNSHGELPEFISFERRVFEVHHGGFTDSLRNGLIKIQDWNLNGIVSGYIFPELIEDFWSDYDIWPKKIVFWFDFSN
jgi:hypothetical protein